MDNLKYLKVLIAFACLCGSGCSNDNSAGPPPNNNTPPTVSLGYGKLAAVRSTDVTLAANTDDADGDPVTVMWQVSRGLLTSNGQPNQIVWSTPSTPGADTLTVTASDGSASTTITEVVLVGTRAAADISASGTHWTLANSPYIVAPATQKLSILPNASLTIDAGVRVLVDQPGNSISVEGQLFGAGTPAQQIVIGPNTRTPNGGFWGGIVGVPPQGQLDFDETWVIYAETAFKALTSARMFLNGCTIKFCTEAAILHNSGGALVVENCVMVSNQKSAIRVKQSTQLPDSIIVQGDSIAVNGRFSDSTNYDDGEAGISIDLNDPGASTRIVITGNEISRNDFPGIRLQTAVYPTIRNNGIFGNELRKVSGKVNVELLVPFAAGSVDATQNWWGQDYAPADSASVKQGIIDHDDNSQIGANVWVSPWRGSWP